MTTLTVVVVIIAIAFYLQRLAALHAATKRIWCRGGHFIGNEPYSFTVAGDAICLECKRRNTESMDRTIAECDAQIKRTDDWLKAQGDKRNTEVKS